MEAGQNVVCIDDAWLWVTPQGAKERMAGPNPVKGQVYEITYVEPCDWLCYADGGPDFLLSLRGFDRRYSHRHFRVVEKRSTSIEALKALAL